MADMDGWSLAILVVAAYIAVTTLSRMMLRRRDEMMGQIRQEVEKNKKRDEKAKKNAKSGGKAA
jgi:hypothetical protein